MIHNIMIQIQDTYYDVAIPIEVHTSIFFTLVFHTEACLNNSIVTFQLHSLYIMHVNMCISR